MAGESQTTLSKREIDYWSNHIEESIEFSCGQTAWKKDEVFFFRKIKALALKQVRKK